MSSVALWHVSNMTVDLDPPYVPPGISRLFSLICSCKLSASSASAGPIRTWGVLRGNALQIVSQPLAPAASLAISSTTKGSPSASTSSSLEVVPASAMAHVTAAPDADQTSMALQSVIADHRTNPVNPL